MKRGIGLKRTTPLKATLWDKVRSLLPKVNKARKARRRAEDLVYGSFFSYVNTLPCAVRGEDECFGKVVGHHLKSVGSGGEDARNLAPLCVRHHRMIHDMGARAFDDRFFQSLPLYALVIWDDYQRSEP